MSRHYEGMRRWVWGCVLIALVVAGCATGVPRGVGMMGSRVRYRSLEPPPAPREQVSVSVGSDFEPVEVKEEEFREAFNRLVLEVPLRVEARPGRRVGGRLERAVWQRGDRRWGEVERGYARDCERRGKPGDCRSLMGEGQQDTTLSEGDRFRLGLMLSLGPAMEGAAGVLGEFSEQAVTVVCTGLGLYLFMLVFPDPVISKGLGLAMTLFLWGYLGVELWGLIEATKQLWEEAKGASTFEELREASERYGRVLGPNTMRLLILLATWSAGAKGKEGMKGGGLPRLNQAVENAAEGGRLRLPEAVAEAEAVAVGEGRLTLTLPVGSGAVLAMQRQGEGQEGDWHHIATVENEKSALRGGPWTLRFKQLFDKAGMSMEDPANKVRVPGHRGPHPKQYHERVYRRLKDAVEDCETTAQCREALTKELERLAAQLRDVGSELNKLVTRSQ